MGWNWVDDEEVKSNQNSMDNPNSFTRRTVTSRCKTEEVEPGRFVKKCDKTEQIFRNSIGRAGEIVESKTEHTEEDVTDEVRSGKHSADSPPLEPFTFPGLRGDIESIERMFAGQLGTFMEAAEKMAEGLFGSFDFPARSGAEPSPRSGGSFPSERRRVEEDGAGDSAEGYDELPGDVMDL